MKKHFFKLIILLLIIALIIIFKIYDFEQYLTLSYIKTHQQFFNNYYHLNQFKTILIYMIIYISVTALSLPGAAVLTLLGGGIFGLLTGTIIVSFASSIGATLAFLVSRYFLRDYVQNKWGLYLKQINEGIKKNGWLYLLTLRLIPAVPFFVINLVMGLTPIKTFVFYGVSQLGMLLGTIVYVNAGKQISTINSVGDVFSLPIILSFTILGIFPLILKVIINIIKASLIYKGHKRPKKFDYNMIAIGAGSGGLVTAYLSSALKSKVALIEKHKMGGDCLNTGCVPSKAIIKSSKVVHEIKNHKKYGIKSASADFDFSDFMERVQEKIKKVEPHDSVERYSKLGVECLQGEAQIISPWEVKINGKSITTKNITIATGATPYVPKIEGIENVPFSTSDTIWNLRDKPNHLLILGGGPIGCELAQAFARLDIKVTLIQRRDRLLPKEDKKVSEFLVSKLKSENINVLLERNPQKFEKNENGYTLNCLNKKNNENEQISFDHLFLALGRKANTNNLWDKNMKIELRDDQTIATNEYLQTNYPNIFACGDVTGPYQLTHFASYQAGYSAINGLFNPIKFKADYRVIPWCTYTDPEISTVGLTEQMAMEGKIPYEVSEYEIDDLDRAITDSADEGFIRVITASGSDQILGVTIVANQSSDMIIEFVLAMKYNLGLNKILNTIHAYPTMGEANKYVAGVWKRKQVNPKSLEILKKFHKWRRS